MSQAASQAAAFYRDVARTRTLWTIEDDRGQMPADWHITVRAVGDAIGIQKYLDFTASDTHPGRRATIVDATKAAS